MTLQLILEEINPELIYIKDSKNIIAVALSCLDKTYNANNFF